MNENVNIINEEVLENAIELVPEKKGINFAKVGIGVLAVGAVAALGYKCYQVIKAKKAAKKAQLEGCQEPVDVEFEEVDK